MLVLVFHERRNLIHINYILEKSKQLVRPGPIAILALTIILLILNLSLYGGNLIRYGRLIPHISQVLTVEQAMKYRLYARNKIIGLFRRNQISYQEAVTKAQAIDHKMDRQHTLALLEQFNQKKGEPDPLMDRVEICMAMVEQNAEIHVRD